MLVAALLQLTHPGQCGRGLCLQPHGGGSEGHKIYYLESRFYIQIIWNRYVVTEPVFKQRDYRRDVLNIVKLKERGKVKGWLGMVTR